MSPPYSKAPVDRGDSIPKTKYITFDFGVLEPCTEMVLHVRKALITFAPFRDFEAALQDIQ